MRAVSFVSRVEFEFKGNFSRNAICLGDVDNDGASIFVFYNICMHCLSAQCVFHS